jgi:hypothetical protein
VSEFFWAAARGSVPNPQPVLSPEVVLLDQVSNLNEMRPVQTQRIYGVLRRECPTDPPAIVEFLEVVLEVVGAQINETDTLFLKI